VDFALIVDFQVITSSIALDFFITVGWGGGGGMELVPFLTLIIFKSLLFKKYFRVLKEIQNIQNSC
jgi:hypothetical protein